MLIKARKAILPLNIYCFNTRIQYDEDMLQQVIHSYCKHKYAKLQCNNSVMFFFYTRNKYKDIIETNIGNIIMILMSFNGFCLAKSLNSKEV